MRASTVVLSLFFVGCSGKDEVVDTGEEVEEAECARETEGDDCFSWEVCEEEKCEVGDRNNSPEEAGQLYWEQETSAVLQNAEDVDYFSFMAEGGEFVRISTLTIDEVEQAEAIANGEDWDEDEDGIIDTILTLYTPIGKVHHVEDEYGAGSVLSYDSIINAYLPYEGEWTVAVEDVEASGSTQATYEIALAEYGTRTREEDSMESPSESVEITNAGSFWAIGVHIGEPGDVDYIELDLPWDGCPLYLIGSEYTDGQDSIPSVEVYDVDGTQLLRKDDLGPGGDAIYPAVNGGSVIVAAQDALGGGGENYWFFIYVQIYEESGWDLETETNDSQADANELTTDWDTNDWGDVGTSRGWGVMDVEDDEDWFWVEVRQDHYLSLFGSADGMGSIMDGYVEVFDANGDSVATGEVGDEDAFPDMRNIGPLDAGVYSIKVTDEGGVGGTPMSYYRFTTYVADYEVAED